MLLSKTLLCALAARAGLAVRQGLKVDRSGTLSTVVEQITALIQAQGKSVVQSKATENIRMLAAITPGANGNLNDALEQVIKEIEKNVDEKIKAAFNETQRKVSESMHDIDTATTVAIDTSLAANAADSTWFECIGVEKKDRAWIETKKKAEGEANALTFKPCSSQEAHNQFDSDPSEEDWSFACDFLEGNCDAGISAFDVRVAEMLAALSEQAEQASDDWNRHKKACDTAENNAKDAEDAHLTAIKTWEDQKALCQDDHEHRQLSMCGFGTALQHKCSKVDAHNDLIKKVDSVEGGEHSEADRKKEWETTHVTKCMLRKIIAGGDLDAKTLENCASAVDVDYAGSVGKFDRQEDTFSTLTSATSFTCEEESITFNGKTWNLPNPEELEPAADAYTEDEQYSEPINLAENSVPFAFCAGAVRGKDRE